MSKRIISLLLALALALCLLPGLALAAEEGGYITQQFTIEKTVQKGDVAAPPAETFTFTLADAEGGSTPLSDYGITLLDELKIATNGVGVTSKNIRVQIDLSKVNETNGWKGYGDSGTTNVRWYSKTFLLTETNGGSTGWTYSTKTYAITFKYTIETGEMTTTLHDPGTDATWWTAQFTASYAGQTQSGSFVIEKTVEKAGTATPSAETFTFELTDAAGGAKPLSACGITLLDDLKIATNGVGVSSKTACFQFDLSKVSKANGWTAYGDSGTTNVRWLSKTFLLKEENGGSAAWTYSTKTYAVTFKYTIETGEMTTTLHDPGTDVTSWTAQFTNSYLGGDSASITVNKTDALGQPLGGAIFVLENGRGGDVYTATSNTRGVAQFTNVGSGTYTLREKSAPAGYVASEKTYIVTVDGARVTMNGASYSPVTFVNRKAAELNRVDHFAFLIGYQDGTFGPGRNMTRAEVTTMFTRLLTEQIDADKTYPNTFTDVPGSHWAANYIGYAQQFGIVTGFSDGSFRPNDPITRAQFAAIACRFEKLTEGTKSFIDVPASYWAAKYINFAATRGWVNGYADGTFKPENHITRAEVSAVTCRLLERSADQSYIRNHLNTLPRTFTDLTENHWSYWYALEAANGHDYTRSGSAETWTRAYR